MKDIAKRIALILAAPILFTLAGAYLMRQPAGGPIAAACARAVFYGGAAAFAAALTSVLYAAIGGLAARRSRLRLIALFAIGRRLAPVTMAIATTGAAVAALAALGWCVAQFGLRGSGDAKLAFFIVVGVGGGLFMGFKAFLATFRALEKSEMTMHGRAVSPEDAPELWALMRHLAREVGAPTPDAIVVGLLGGPFVTAADMRLAPANVAVTGRILYLPLPVLLILDIAQLSCVLSHELAHFSGEDVEYSLQLAPSYAALGQGLHAVSESESGGFAGLVVALPAISQLVLLLECFDLAVQHWSRERELRADRISAQTIGPDFAATALARYAAFDGVIGAALENIVEAPQAPRSDIVAEIAHAVRAAGPQDPGAHLEERTPHPTDSHPPIAARVEALGQKIDKAFLAEAGMSAPADHTELLPLFFKDAPGLCRRLTADFVDELRKQYKMAQAREQMAAAAYCEERD